MQVGDIQSTKIRAVGLSSQSASERVKSMALVVRGSKGPNKKEKHTIGQEAIGFNRTKRPID